MSLTLLETDSLSNQNISSALAIGSYTVAATGLHYVDFEAIQVAGSGDYLYYVTRTRSGGSEVIVSPTTTVTLAAGVTTLGGQSGPISAVTGDVLTVYLDGLAGDTSTPDTVVRWYKFDALEPVTAGTKVAVDTFNRVTAIVSSVSSGGIGASSFAAGAITSSALDTTAADEIASSVWSATPRTLTQTASAVTAAVAGSTLTIHRGDTFSATLTGISSNTGYVSIDFTVKRSYDDTDANAIVKIRKNASGTDDGLLYLNGAAGTAAQGTITVNSATSLTIALSALSSDDLVPETGLYYDIQYIMAASVTTATYGTCNISADVTRAVA